MADLTIVPPTAAVVQGPKPILCPWSVLSLTQPISLGQSFQVTTTIQNKGNLDAPAYHVRFLLVGTNGDLTTGLYLEEHHPSDRSESGLQPERGADPQVPEHRLPERD